jgi:hypothetical protein
MKLYCRNCGVKLDDDSLFCNKCGAAVPEAFPEPETFSSAPVRDVGQQAPVKLSEPPDSPSENSVMVEFEPDFDEERPESVKLPRKAWVTVASTMLSIILFVVISAGQAWFVLQNTVSNQAIKAMARTVLGELDFTALTVSDFVDTDSVSIPGVEPGEEAGLQDVIFDTIDGYYTETFGVKQDHIKELLQHPAARDFLGEIIDGGVDYITGGDDSNIVTSERVTNLILENSGEIERITSYKLVETDYEDIAEVLRESGLDDITWGSAIGEFGGVNSIRTALARFDSYSDVIMIVILSSAAIILVLMIVLNRRRVSNSALYFGIPCVVSGAFVVAARFILLNAFKAVALTMFGVSVDVILNAFSGVTDIVMYTGIVTLGAGVITIIIGIIGKKAKSA